MENESLATEIIRDLKTHSRRCFIVMIICIILLFVSNIIWMTMWRMYGNENSYNSLVGEDYSRVVYNNQGEVSIDGENESQ